MPWAMASKSSEQTLSPRSLHHILELVERLSCSLGLQRIHSGEQLVWDVPRCNLGKGIVNVHDLRCWHRGNDATQTCNHSLVVSRWCYAVVVDAADGFVVGF